MGKFILKVCPNSAVKTMLVYEYTCWYNSESCWHNLCVNPAGLFSYIFPVYKLRWIKPAFRLTKRYLVYCWATKLASVKSAHAASWKAWQWYMKRGGNQPQSRKKEPISRFKLFLHRGINTVPKFLWMCNTDCMLSTCTALIVHAICEGLHL